MSSLKKQHKSFDPSNNPFLKATNPYRIAEKFYTHSCSQQKLSNESSKKNLKNSCNHCVKNSSFIEELNQRSTFLRNEKQNIQKMSSLKYRAGRATQNPFQRKRLIIRDQNIQNNQEILYSRKDQQKLASLLQNNPFKKYQERRENLNKDDQIDVQFHQIKMEKTHDIAYNNPIKIDESNTKLKIKNHLLNYSTIRNSIELSNSNRLKQIDSVQNSPVKRNKMPPTFANIQTHRRSSTSSSQEKQFLSLCNQNEGLMRQISRSRKQLIQTNSKKQIKIIDNNFVQKDRVQQSAIKQVQSEINQVSENKQKINFEQILVKGRRFFLNQVKLKY